ncbi:hypothetical protein C3B79_0615 [Aeromonas hydrophila]|nr:hypothetical protein C3B79_0615 [Aeromonas hydrophila]
MGQALRLIVAGRDYAPRMAREITEDPRTTRSHAKKHPI